VQIANNVYFGKGFDHYSSTNGGQWGFNLQWKRAPDGNWWLFYKGPGNYIKRVPTAFTGSKIAGGAGGLRIQIGMSTIVLGRGFAITET
jgi:hypothetical protein